MPPKPKGEMPTTTGVLTAPQELNTVTFVYLAGMSVALQASYLYEGYVRVAASGASGAFGKFLPPGGATIQWGDTLTQGSFNEKTDADLLAATDEAAIEVGGSAPMYTEYFAQIQTDAAGNLQFQGRIDAEPGSATIDAGYLRVQPIGPL